MAKAIVRARLFEVMDVVSDWREPGKACNKARVMFASLLVLEGQGIKSEYANSLMRELYEKVSGISYEDFESYIYAYLR